MHNAANLITTERVPVLPAGRVMIVGFPRAITVGPGLPILKSGYIASEPHFDINLGKDRNITIPAFFLDASTREGMSGSPVFAVYQGTFWRTDDPYSRVDPDDPSSWDPVNTVITGKGTEFVGCYSGRVLAREEEAALRLCWKREAIELICASRETGDHPHIDRLGD